MEKIISSLDTPTWVGITHASDIAAARRVAQRMAQGQGFDDTRAGQLSIVVTELATNMLKHAGEGRIQLSHVYGGDARGIDVLGYDRGPGIANLAAALRDGVSSTGTAGSGLGALRRLSDQFDVYAPRGKGAVFFMRLWAGAPPDKQLQSGGVCLPLAGETESGDAWAVARLRREITLLMADGLGHGPEAAEASSAAIHAMTLQPSLRPAEQMEVCHTALRATRGAAMAVALLDPEVRELRFAGVGNIGACIVDGGPRRQLVSHNGIVGHNMRKVQEFTLPCAPGALVILASDGITTQWDLDQHPGLVACDPSIIAAVLLRDFARGRDDASVLVQRCPEAA